MRDSADLSGDNLRSGTPLLLARQLVHPAVQLTEQLDGGSARFWTEGTAVISARVTRQRPGQIGSGVQCVISS
ncbi:hypothetical protein [Deinococcus hopiensis]|nr:hypothetical protein [Deinococcus hopiensis]